MKKTFLLVLLYVLLVVFFVSACATVPQQQTLVATDTHILATETLIPPSETIILPTDTFTSVPPSSTPEPPTRTPFPTSTKKPTAMNKPIESAEEIVGAWENDVEGGMYYIRFNQDGTFQASSVTSASLDNSPAVLGEYWFEDGLLHVGDTSNLMNDRGWPTCDSAMIGIYWVTMVSPTKIKLKAKTDPCSECGGEGFCRRYILYGDWERMDE